MWGGNSTGIREGRSSTIELNSRRCGVSARTPAEIETSFLRREKRCQDAAVACRRGRFTKGVIQEIKANPSAVSWGIRFKSHARFSQWGGERWVSFGSHQMSGTPSGRSGWGNNYWLGSNRSTRKGGRTRRKRVLDEDRKKPNFCWRDGSARRHHVIEGRRSLDQKRIPGREDRVLVPVRETRGQALDVLI